MPLRLRCEELVPLIEALKRGEEYKPFQVAKRAVFEEHGIAGSVLDRVYTAILYRYFRALGLVEKIVSECGVDLEKLDPYTAVIAKLYAFLKHIARIERDSVRSAIERCPRRLAEVLSIDAVKLESVLHSVGKCVYEPSTPEEELAFRYYVPSYLIELVKPLLRDWREVEAFLKSINEAPTLAFRVNTMKSCVERVVEELRAMGVEAWPSDRVPNVVRYRGVLDYRKFEPLVRGEVVPQDEPSALASIILDPRPGELVLDMCAAPGGKTTHIAELTRCRATVVAVDLYPDRMARLVEIAVRTSTYSAIVPLLTDARILPNIVERKFDRILLDPPCSSTGVLAKHPDARWRLSPDKILELVDLQRELLEAAHRLLKVGGYLLYTTCSITVPENEGNIRWFLHRHPCYELVPIQGPYDRSPLMPQAMRSWPHRHGVSGFFYALLRKVGEC